MFSAKQFVPDIKEVPHQPVQPRITLQKFPKRHPRELRPKHIGANGKIETDAESKKIQERIGALGVINDVIDRSLLKSSFDILVTDDPTSYYTIYRNPNPDSKQHDSDSEDEFGVPLKHTLGEGTFGTVSLCQHSTTKTLYALKEAIQDEDTENEFPMLKKAKVGIFQLIKEKQVTTLMELAPGVSLSDYLEAHEKQISQNKDQPQVKYHPLQDYHYLQIILGMLRCIQPLHQNGIVHLDIKCLNFRFEPITREMKLIDLGCAVEVKDDQPIKHKVVGTPGYIAPEVKNEMVQKASDIYSVAIVIADMLNMITEKTRDYGKLALLRRPYQLLNPDTKEFKNTTQIKETDRCKKILTILHRMTQLDAKKRPAIEECIKLFEQLELDHQKNNSVKIGIVNLADLVNQTDPSKEKISKQNFVGLAAHIKSLNFDEVWFVDVNGSFSDEQKQQVERRLRRRRIFVADKIFTAPGAKVEDVIKGIPDILMELNDHRKYFGMHVQDLHTAVQVDLKRKKKLVPSSMFSSQPIADNVNKTSENKMNIMTSLKMNSSL